jgi:hypothetical protein
VLKLVYIGTVSTQLRYIDFGIPVKVY